MKKKSALLCLVLCLMLPLCAFAQRVEPEHAASLTLQVAYAGMNIPGATFDAYRVASMDGDARFTLLTGYQAAGVDINKVDGAAAWSALAASLTQQVGLPTATAMTNQQGRAVFSNLKSGLYLIIGQPVEIDEYVYDYAAFMVSVPGKEDGEWQYDAVADVKVQPAPRIFDLKVLKYWKDAGYVDQRPETITVDLYCDGAVADTVTLSEKNNWTYTFTGLERTHEWMVREQKVPSGYVVAYSQQGDARIITNTFSQKVPGQQVIPQTGLTWWPVPVMGLLGIALVMIGVALRRKWSNEHDQG